MAEKGYQVIRGNEEKFLSKLVATRAFKKGDLIAKIPFKYAAPGEKTYQTVQVGEDKHIWLQDELVYMNHSCDPNTMWDLTKFEIYAVKDIAKGEEFSFFYPSSEWDMAQPFDCFCKAPSCLHRIAGAKHIAADVLAKYYVSEHIKRMKQAQH